MALTRITKGVIKPNENYDTHNIVSTGIVTSVGLDVNGNADVSGSLSVGGVLTYEDVTNIDSVGIITAQKDIHVGAGVSAVGVGTFGSLDIGGDIDVDGHTNLDNVSVAGVSTFTGTVNLSTINSTASALTIHNTADRVLIKGSNRIDLADDQVRFQNRAQNAALLDATSSYVKLYQSGNEKLATYSGGVSISGNIIASGNIQANTNITISNIAPQLFLVDTNNDSDFAVQNINGSFIVNDTTNSANRFTINSSGNSTFANDLDVDGHTNLDNVSIAGVSTFAGTITAATVNATGGAFTGNLRFSNNVGTLFGASDELQVFHNSGTSYISHNGSGQLQLRAKSNEHGIKIFPDGAVELYHDNTKRLETTATGIKVTGTTATGSVFLGDFRVKNTNDTNFVTFKPAESLVRWHDNHKAVFGGSNDFQLFHNGTDNFIRTENGSIRVTNYGENMAKFIPNGAVELYHDNIKRLETSSVGVSIPQDLDVDGHTNLDNVNIAGVVTATSYYGDGSNLSNVISGVDVKFEGASVGTGVTMLNFVGFNTVTPPASGLSTITSGQNLTIGVRSGSAVEASLTGTSFNVIARSGGNISINI